MNGSMTNISSIINLSSSFFENRVLYGEGTINQKTRDLIKIAAKEGELI
jgi:hypothetical protein